MTWLLALAALLWAPLALSAQLRPAAEVDSVDAFIARVMAEQQVPGVAVAVMRNGKVVLTKGYGFADLEHKVPVTPRTVFQSGSVGKAFTVMAVLMLVDDGRVRLDAPLATYFPNAPSVWATITVRHLLEHTSGLPGYPDDFDFRRDRTEDELFAIIGEQPLGFPVGAQRGYSNLGFILLGILVHKVTGTFYGDFLAERLFRPIGMPTARVNSEADVILDRARGYQLVEGALKNQEWVAPTLNTTADGSLLLSALDMAAWDAALQERRLLSAGSYARMWTRLVTTDGAEQPFGFSWQLPDVSAQRLIEHSGGWQGFTANYSHYPATGLSVAVFLNRRGVDPIRVTRGIQRIVQPELSIAGAPSIADPDAEMAVFVREFVVDVANGRMRASQFAPSIAEEILAGADRGKERFQSYGTMQRVELLSRTVTPQGVRQVAYRLTFSARQIVLRLDRDARGIITNIAVQEE